MSVSGLIPNGIFLLYSKLVSVTLSLLPVASYYSSTHLDLRHVEADYVERRIEARFEVAERVDLDECAPLHLHLAVRHPQPHVLALLGRSDRVQLDRLLLHADFKSVVLSLDNFKILSEICQKIG